MRTPSTDLFELVKSMTVGEKRFFRSYARQYNHDKQTQHLQLFTLIDQQEVYDETSLKAAFDSQMSDNQFAVAKNYLYTTLLKALSAYLGDRGGIKKVRQQLKMLEVLFQKELMGQCEKLLPRILDQARRYDHPILRLEVLDWQRRIWNKRYFQGLGSGDLGAYQQECLEVTEQMHRYLRLNLLHAEFMFHLRMQGFLQSPAEMERLFADILHHPLLQDASQANSFAARIPFHYTWGIYHLMMGKAQLAHRHLSQLIEELDESPDFAYDYFELYVSVQYHYGIACLMLDRYDEARLAVHNLEGLKASFTSQRARIFHCTFLLRAEVFAGTLRFEEGLQEATDAAEKLPLYQKQLTAAEHISLAFTIAYTFFVNGQYRLCQRLIVQEMGPDRMGGNPDLLVTVDVLRLILYFEMEEDDLFVQTYRSLYRFLRKWRPRYRLENHLLKAIRRYPPNNDPATVKAFFAQLLHDMEEMGKDPHLRRTIQTFKFDTWLRSKIEGITMLETIRRQIMASSGNPSQ